MFLLFLGAMWFIFAPSEEDRRKEEKNAGFNTELPDPRGCLLYTSFVIFVVMYMAGIDQWVCIGFGVVSASVLV